MYMSEIKQSTIQKTLESMQNYLHESQYANGSMKNLLKIWEITTEYAVANGYSTFSEEWVMPFIDAYIEAAGKSVSYSRLCQYYRAAKMLCEYQKNGKIIRLTVKKKLVKNPETYKALYDAADKYSERHQLHESTKGAYLNEVNKLVTFMEKSNVILENLSFDVMCEYLQTISHQKQSSISFIHAILRNIFDILYSEGKIKRDLSAVCEKIKIPAHRRIPSVFAPEEIERVLSAVDRANSIGKRDYTILLLAARLGLRVSDIRTLKFEDINWNTCEICLVQTKTKKEIALPLSDEVGMAIIDYVKNGRPQTDSQNIFVRHTQPFIGFSSNGNFSELLGKYLRRAGIKIPHDKARGLHTLRHSLASNMLAEGTALPVVSEILGHDKIDNTMIYLKVSIPQLRQCSLNADFGGAL
jgi:site-specific recombinase XerD